MPKISIMYLMILFLSLAIPKEHIIIRVAERISKPIQPDELKSNARITEAVIRTVIPEEIPEISVARKIGISEKSAFK